MRAAVGIAASLALCALIIQVFESRGSTTELLRSRGFERLDPSAPKSPIQYWGLGGIGRARKWGPSPYRSIVTFRPHKGGKAHHAKLIHLKHNAELEREAAGFFPSERDFRQGGRQRAHGHTLCYLTRSPAVRARRGGGGAQGRDAQRGGGSGGGGCAAAHAHAQHPA